MAAETLKQLLEEPSVHCKDIEAVIDSVRRMKIAGRHKLQVKKIRKCIKLNELYPGID